nr:MAG TPA: hypothetical protein [Caudoviricetes sp.]
MGRPCPAAGRCGGGMGGRPARRWAGPPSRNRPPESPIRAGKTRRRAAAHRRLAGCIGTATAMAAVCPKTGGGTRTNPRAIRQTNRIIEQGY